MLNKISHDVLHCHGMMQDLCLFVLSCLIGSFKVQGQVMKRKRCSTNGSCADKEAGVGAACNQSKEVVIGELIWVSLHGSSWWPAQVF